MVTTRDIIANLRANLKVEGADLVDTVKGVILFDIDGDEYTLDLSSGAGSVEDGVHGNPDLKVSVSADNFAKLVGGKLNPQQAFLFRKLKLKGSMAMAMKLTSVLQVANKKPSKL